jgi:hypothetical protein
MTYRGEDRALGENGSNICCFAPSASGVSPCPRRCRTCAASAAAASWRSPSTTATSTTSIALPFLRRYGHSAMCYVTSGVLGSCNTWDVAEVGVRKPIMDAAQLRAWHGAGMEVGAHTRSHARLPTLDDDRLELEVAGSRRDLEALLGVEVRHFRLLACRRSTAASTWTASRPPCPWRCPCSRMRLSSARGPVQHGKGAAGVGGCVAAHRRRPARRASAARHRFNDVMAPAFAARGAEMDPAGVLQRL